MLQEILSLGNSVAATIFSKEIMSLSIIEATVFPKETMSLPGNCVAHARCTCSIDTSWLSLQRMEQREYDMLLAFCCDCKYPPECSKNEKDCIRRRAKNFIVNEGLLFYRDKDNKEYRVSYMYKYAYKYISHGQKLHAFITNS